MANCRMPPAPCRQWTSSSYPGRSGPAAARAAPPAGLARVRYLSTARGIRGQPGDRHPATGAQPWSSTDRRADDRHQHLRCALPGIDRDGVAAPRGAPARTLAADCRGRTPLRRVFACQARFAGAGEFPCPPPQGRSLALSRFVAGDRQADGFGRICGRAPGRSGGRPFRPRAARLHPLDGAESEVSRPDHDAAAEVGAERQQIAVQSGRARSAGAALHSPGRRGAKGRAAHAQVGRGVVPAVADRTGIRCHRHRTLDRRHLGANPHAAGGGHAGRADVPISISARSCASSSSRPMSSKVLSISCLADEPGRPFAMRGKASPLATLPTVRRCSPARSGRRKRRPMPCRLEVAGRAAGPPMPAQDRQQSGASQGPRMPYHTVAIASSGKKIPIVRRVASITIAIASPGARSRSSLVCTDRQGFGVGGCPPSSLTLPKGRFVTACATCAVGRP